MVPVRTSARKIAEGLTKKTPKNAKEAFLVYDRCLIQAGIRPWCFLEEAQWVADPWSPALGGTQLCQGETLRVGATPERLLTHLP